jgi:6-phosphogluconolactonase
MDNLPESITVYIGTYTQRESFVDGKADGIYAYELDPASGALTYRATVPGVVNPSFLAVDERKRYLYAVNEISSAHGKHGTVSAFAIDPATKALSYLNEQSTHGLAPCHLSLDSTGSYVMVANYESGNLCVLPLERDGSLGAATDVVQHHGSGPDAQRQEGPHAHMVLPSLGGRTVYAVDLGIDKILRYGLDAQRGKLLPLDPPWMQLAPGTGPRHLAFHPSGRFAYVISELQSAVVALRVNAEQGTLTPIQTILTLPAGFAGENSGAEIDVAPSGRFVYASNRGHDSIAVYSLNQATGELTLVGHQSTLGRGPRHFVSDPSGRFLFVANQDSDTVVTFRINQDYGLLETTGHVADVPTPVCVWLLA